MRFKTCFHLDRMIEIVSWIEETVRKQEWKKSTPNQQGEIIAPHS